MIRTNQSPPPRTRPPPVVNVDGYADEFGEFPLFLCSALPQKMVCKQIAVFIGHTFNAHNMPLMCVQ